MLRISKIGPSLSILLAQLRFPSLLRGAGRTEEAQGLLFPLLRKGHEERTELRLPLPQLLSLKCWRREQLPSRRDKAIQS